MRRTPLAIGSSVPQCPTRWAPNLRFTYATQSKDVSPVGLSKSNKPPACSVVIKVGNRGFPIRALFRAGRERPILFEPLLRYCLKQTSGRAHFSNFQDFLNGRE